MTEQDSDGSEVEMMKRNIILLIIGAWGVPIFSMLWESRHVRFSEDVVPLTGWIILSIGTTAWCYWIGRTYQIFGPEALAEGNMVPAEDVWAIKIRLALCFVFLFLPALGFGVLGPVLWT